MADEEAVAVTMPLLVVMLKGNEEVGVTVTISLVLAVAVALLDAVTMVPVALAGIETLPVAVEVALPPKAEDEADAKMVEELKLPFDEADEMTKLEAMAELDGKAEPEKLDTEVVVGLGTLNEPTFEVDGSGMESVALQVSL